MRHTDTKGTEMTPTERSTKTPSPRTGLFATLRAFLRRQGSGAPSAALALALAFAGLLALSATSAVAAPPVSFSSTGSSVAVDNSTDLLDPAKGTVYVSVPANAKPGFVNEFASNGTFLRAFGSGDPSAVAVDNSAGPSAGDVYVSDSAGLNVAKFSPSGQLLLTFGSAGTGPGQFSPPIRNEVARLPVAVDASGNLWVGDRNRLEEFNEKGEYVTEVKIPGIALPSALAIDTDPSSPSSGDFYVSVSATPHDETQEIIPPASGSYTLTFEGQTTAPLPFNAGEVEVKAALEALSTIGAGNVGEGAVHQKNFEVTFLGALENKNLPLITASSGSVVIIEEGSSGQLLKTKPDGTVLETLDASGHPMAIGLDPATGDLFVVDTPPEGSRTEHTLLQYGPSGAELAAFGAGEVLGEFGTSSGNALAFGDAAGALYVVSDRAAQIFTLPAPGPLVRSGSTTATEIGKTSAILNATVDPEGRATTYHFQYLTEAQFKADGETFGAGTLTTKPESASIGEDFREYPTTAAITGLKFETAYRFRVIATNSNAPGGIDGETATFITLPPLRVDSTSASEVTATSATLAAEVNPLGEAATYHFEYLTEAAYVANGGSFSGAQPAISVPQPDGALGSGDVDVEVGRHLQGLASDTVYRYRVVGVDSVAPEGIAGPALTFTTQGSGGPLVLPDGREWELVSPADKHGADILPIFKVAPGTQAAAAGGAMAFVTTAPTEAEPAGSSNFSQILSSRTATGWSSKDLALPHNEGTGLSNDVSEYPVLSSDLSLGVARPFGAFNPSLSEEASEQTGYLRSNYLHGDPGAFCTTSCYRPLVTGAPGFANVPPGTEFGTKFENHTTCPPQPLCGPQIVGATPDLSHIVLSSGVGLTSTPGDAGGLYEWSGGQLQLVSVLPGGTPAGRRSVLGQGVEEIGGGALGFEPVDVRHAISADGSRVYFTYGGLYAREGIGTPQARTVAVPGGGFQTASADGSRVFVLGGGALSEFDLETETSVPLAAGVLGVIGASEDGSSVYFVSNAKLAPEAAEGTCIETVQGGKEVQPPRATCNLYLSRDGETKLITVLSGADSPDWGNGLSDLHRMTARVSPGGGWLAFMSQRSLTGYDNRDAVSGVSDEEVYLYHASTGGGVGALVCASCDPTGARPHGVEYERLTFGHGAGLVGGGNGVWAPNQWLAANVPGWTSPFHQSRYLSDSGRLFFNSSDALVPQDTNNTEDVYQYEPLKSEAAPAGDTCSTGSATYSSRSEGCVSLISSGTSPEESAFLDASESGGDVFFLTAAKLSSVDVDSAIDVYDAHECSVSSPCPPPPPAPAPACEGDACQSPVAAPEDPTPGSLSFHGPGNLAPLAAAPPVKKTTTKTVKCKKHKKLSRGKVRPECVKKAKVKHKPARKLVRGKSGRS